MKKILKAKNRTDLRNAQFRAELQEEKEIFYDAASLLPAERHKIVELLEFQLLKCSINLREILHAVSKLTGKENFMLTHVDNHAFIAAIMSIRRIWEVLEDLPEYHRFCSEEAHKHINMKLYLRCKISLKHWNTSLLMTAERNACRELIKAALPDLKNKY